MRFNRSVNNLSPHDNLFLNLPEYGSSERVEKIELLTKIINDYANTEFPNLAPYCRKPEQNQWFSAPFGEHYKLINSLCKSLSLRKVVEVGSFTGMSALIWMLNNVSLTSIDIVPWNEFDDTVLSDALIQDASFSQKILDLMDVDSFNEMIPDFLSSDLIFLDGPKDGIFEQEVVPKLINLLSGRSVWLLLDDIHLRAMQPCWDAITNEKYDLSLIGHSSGTGLVRL